VAHEPFASLIGKAKSLAESCLEKTKPGDNGNGFDVAAVMKDSKTAHGLLVIQDRLGLMGCKTKITSEPGKGKHLLHHSIIKITEDI